MRLKPIEKQSVVVLGASSGIGRETALRLAARGAAVTVAARGEDGLASLVAEITTSGGRATHVACDAADIDQVRRVAEVAIRTFGTIDTWVNDVAVSAYGRFEDTSPDEFRRLMEVNYLGHVHGAQVALPYLRQAGGGALVFISSVESMVSLPLHSAYAASKHAVEGMLDALRRELIAEGAPISVTSIKPGTINTPFFDNSLNKMDVKPMGPPPIYEPSVVADCVVYAAAHPVRDLYAGGAARMMVASQMLAPGLVDLVLGRFGIPAQRTDEPRLPGRSGNLYAPRTEESRARGDFSDQAHELSLYTWLSTHPWARTLATGGLLVGAAMLLGGKHARPSWRSLASIAG